MYVFYICGQMMITNLQVAKVCEHPKLTVNLTVKFSINENNSQGLFKECGSMNV